MTQRHPLRFLSFMAVNAPLDRPRLRRHMEELQAAGLDGVVFHPRYYPNSPPYLGAEYLRLVSEMILDAKAMGLEFWLYDENGWPSGSVGGELLRRFPECRQQWAGLVQGKADRVLAEFEHDGQSWRLALMDGPGVDYLNPQFTRHFIDLTHERYRTGLAPEAFDYVSAFFTDEPEFGIGHAFDDLPPEGGIPWTPHLPELFRQRNGEDFAPLLPRLFFGDTSDDARVRFWEFLSDLFNESFTKPINDWCAAHGKRFAGHIKGEEHPLFQVPMVGSCDRFFRSLSLPGIDALERFPSNDFFPRQVASAAAQFGDGRCMVECFGGSGWGASPEDLERYLLWLGRHGLTDFVLHLSQFRLDSAAIRDWPPSHPLHMSWREAYPHVLAKVRKTLESSAPTKYDTLVITSHRGIMEQWHPRELPGINIHNAATYPDSAAGRINARFLKLVESLNDQGVVHHFCDERTLEEFGHAKSEHGLQIGNANYRRIILSDDCCLRPATNHLLVEAEAVGVQVKRGFTEEAAVVSAPVDPDENPGVELSWTMVEPPENALVLEASAESDGSFHCVFVAGPISQPLTLWIADDVSELTLNEVPLPLTPVEDGTTATIHATDGENILHFRCPKITAAPFVALRGRFLVQSESLYSSGPNSTVCTKGPFRLTAAHKTDPHQDFVHSGYPFLRMPVRLETEIVLPTPATRLTFQDVRADAIQLSLNGTNLGWIWGPDWSLELITPIPTGPHRLRIQLVSSTYNFFGPHRHIDGDRKVVSPDQFNGKKNFADHPKSPDFTLGPLWHFKPLQAPTVLRF